jgi:thiopeptide-type bacteriocin biosynthesis protein
MINIRFNQYLFLRTPALSFVDYRIENFELLLKTQFFQTAIFFASESLYMELSRYEFDYNRLEEKVRLSLRKYINRMCYRPTPFGMFSAFTSLNWSAAGGDAPHCFLSDEDTLYVNPDFQFTVDIARKIEKSPAFSDLKYYSNNTIYTIKGEKRYLTYSFDDDHKKTDFLIISFQTDRLLNRLLAYCKAGKNKNEIIAWLMDLSGDAGEVEDYINDLIEAGLLIPEHLPNMTGKKYFDRLVDITNEKGDAENTFVNEILTYKKLLDDINLKGELNLKELNSNRLYNISKNKLKSMFYVGYEKKTLSSLDQMHQETIRDGLYALSRLALESSPKALINFKNKFRARFEDQEVSILHALDRETGIGYEGLESNLVASELLDGIQLDLQANSLNFNWTPVHEFFLSRLSGQVEGGHIVIKEKELAKLRGVSALKLPPSFSVIFRLFEDKVWIEQAGGSSAAALLGRFTLFSEKVMEETTRITNAEEQMNKEIIFAEVSCFNDEHAANINAIGSFRNYEIPIGVHSTRAEENIISLSDILISVVEQKIILRSKKLNKIIVPRLSSAYNYGRSDLSIFRFLCDLQFQDLASGYNLDLKTLLPGLGYYPRVEYKRCILSPATWVLNTEDISLLTAGGCKPADFKKLSLKIKLQRLFALTEGDNQLIFDQENEEELNLFLKTIKNKKSAVLQEVFIDQASVVRNHMDQPLIGQFIASVFSNEATYNRKPELPVTRRKNKVKRIYLPGDEWVYLKVYCHPAITNTILTRNIKSVVQSLKKQSVLKGWYFIRYADPDHHLRIRIQVNKSDTAAVVKCFERKLRKYVEKGSVSNILIDTYKREIERYGENTIEYVEKIFQISSEMISNYLKMIANNRTDYSELHLALISVDEILNVFFVNNSGKMQLMRSIYDTMKHEFDESKSVKLQLDSKYREYSPFINNMVDYKELIIGYSGKKEFGMLMKALQQLKMTTYCDFTGSVPKLAGDLIHMHLNRLFNERQRQHEFIIYYLLLKFYSSVEARNIKQMLSVSVGSKRFSIDNIKEAVFK